MGVAVALLVDGLGFISGSSQQGGEVDNAWGFLLVDGHGLLPQVLSEFLALGAPTIRGGPASVVPISANYRCSKARTYCPHLAWE